MTVVGAFQLGCKLFTGHSLAAFAQRFDDVDVSFRVFVERVEQSFELTSHFGVSAEKEAVDVLHQAFILVEQT